MQRRFFFKILNPILLFALIFTISAPAVNPAVQAEMLATPPLQELAAPVLLSTMPASGGSWDGSPVVFTFDQPMASAELAVTPELAGETTVDGA
ncbi:MAG: hypothetical protein ACK47M_14895, partial [Caldilinea sp.]